MGTGAWALTNCIVQQVQYEDGSTSNIASKGALDPVVGMSIDCVPGKIVDLDSEQQNVSALWGFRVSLAKPQPIGLPVTIFGGDYEVASFGDIWIRDLSPTPSDVDAAAFFQSVITLDQINLDGMDSQFLKQLKTALGNGNKLSIKINVDGYGSPSSLASNYGRVTGVIGVYHDGEPYRFVKGRTIANVPVTPNGAFYTGEYQTAYAILDNNWLHLDLGNTMPTASPGGSLKAVGDIAIAIDNGSPTPTILQWLEQSQYTYQSQVTTPAGAKLDISWYTNTAGVVAIPLSAENTKLAANHPLALVQLNAGNPSYTPLAIEAKNGEYVSADQFVFRLNPPYHNPADTNPPIPSEPQHVQLYATKFGRPMSQDTEIFLVQDSTTLGAQRPIEGPPVGVPESCLKFPEKVKLDVNGEATFEVQATDPGNPRRYIDGQVYCLAYQIGSAPTVGQIQNSNQLLSFLVFSGYHIPQTPTWIEDVQPIFKQYYDLYPVMRKIVNLGNYADVMKHIPILKNVFKTPISNANYMPVTRDLSDSKRKMLLNWLDNPKYLDIHSIDQLKMALQIAIELEHATIPPYLTAYYSLKPGANDEVAALILSIIKEEMLHMTIACNILIALGGHPAIGNQGFVPTYPGNLPGGIREGLTVNLKKCSIEQIRDCFMSIEMPEEMLRERHHRLNGPVKTTPFTIGWFYDQIVDALKAQKPEVILPKKPNQVQWITAIDQVPFPISSWEDAIAGIKFIQDEGEGTGVIPTFDIHHKQELSHYYKFAEIVEGRQLVKTPGGFAYEGAKIPFSPEEVWPMVDNPGLVKFPAGSTAAVLSQEFAQSYQNLLLSLNETFNGNPENLSNAIGHMYSMGIVAGKLMQTPSGFNDDTTAGPQFVTNLNP